MRIISRRRIGHSPSTPHVRMAQVIRETLQIIGAYIVIIIKHVVMCRLRSALKNKLRLNYRSKTDISKFHRAPYLNALLRTEVEVEFTFVGYVMVNYRSRRYIFTPKYYAVSIVTYSFGLWNLI